MTLPPEIFKAYDIRGVVGKTLTPPIVRSIGRALGSLAQERGRDTMVVGRDGRLSGPELAGACHGGNPRVGSACRRRRMVTTPMTYFAAHHLGTQSSVMVTGSHNPPDYNGLKMVVDGTTLSGADIQDIRARIDAGRLATGRRKLAERRHRGGLRRSHRGGSAARASAEDRGGLRQWRRRSLRAGACSAGWAATSRRCSAPSTDIFRTTTRTRRSPRTCAI
jgi:phosphomannomutase